LNGQDRGEQVSLDISIKIRRTDYVLPASRSVPRNVRASPRRMRERWYLSVSDPVDNKLLGVIKLGDGQPGARFLSTAWLFA